MKITIDCAHGCTKPAKAESTEAAMDYGCEACEYIFENKVTRCSKFVYLSGQDPQNEKQFIDEGKCVDAWQPILMLEMSNTNRGQTKALESFRNESVNQQTEFNEIMSQSVANTHTPIGKIS